MIVKKKNSLKYLSILTFLIGFTLHSSADDGRADFSAITHSYSFGIEATRYFYKESDIHQDRLVPKYGAVWMNHTGNLYGLNSSYRMTWKNTLFVQPEGRFIWGTHAYRTGRKKEIYGKAKNKIPVILYEPRLIVGGTFSLIDQIKVLPYIGLGYRFKSDDGEEVKTQRGNRLAYRKSNYVYVPLGASAEYLLNDTWSVSLKGEYDWIVKAWQYSRSNLTGSKTFIQPNGYGIKGDVSVNYTYKTVKFSISPYVNYWNIRNSQEKNIRGNDGEMYNTMEPYNITWESGIKLGVTF